MIHVLNQNVMSAIERSADASFEELIAQLGPLTDDISDPVLHAAAWDERLVTYYRNRLVPVLRSMGDEGTKIRHSLGEPGAIRNANVVASLVILLALVTGSEHASASNLTALALAIILSIAKSRAE